MICVVYIIQSTRSAFGRPLIEQPLMRNLLTDLCIESEAHTLMALRMAAAYDDYKNNSANTSGSDNDPSYDLFRLGIAVSKYYVTKRLPNFTYECLEVRF